MLEKISRLFVVRRFFPAFDPDGVQMDVPGEDGKIGVFIDEDALVPALIQMS